MPENGMVLYFGTADDVDYKEILEPPLPIPYFAYRCDSSFFLEPLYDMVKSHEMYGILVVDLGEATIGYMQGKSIKMIANVQSLVPNKHNHGGQSAVRFERLRDDAINEYFKKISDICTEAFLGKELRGLIVGGPGMTKENFLKENYLHHELRKQILGTVNTGYTSEYGLKEALAASQSIMAETEYAQEKLVMDRFWEELRSERLSVYGYDPTLSALSGGKMDTLILSEDLDATSMEHLINIAERYGTRIVNVSKDTENGEMFTKTFKVGGILRY